MMAQLARDLEMTHRNLRQIVAILVRKGFVARAPDPSDARAVRLRLTARHQRFGQQRDSADHAEVAAWTEALSTAEVRAAVAALSKLHQALKTQPA